MISLRRSLLLGTGLLLNGACTEATSSVSADSQRLDVGRIPPIEVLLGSESLRIIREVPGYGGRWSDEYGNLHACLVNLADSDRLREVLRPVQANERSSYRRPLPPDRTIVIHRCDYTVAQLSRWRCIVGNAAGDRVPEFTLLSINHTANRVRVGVSSKEGIKKIRALLAMTEVPLRAVIFELSGPIVAL